MSRPKELTLPCPPTRTLIEQDLAAAWLRDEVGIDPGVVPVDGITFTSYGVDVERVQTDVDGNYVVDQRANTLVRELAARVTLTGAVPPG